MISLKRFITSDYILHYIDLVLCMIFILGACCFNLMFCDYVLIGLLDPLGGTDATSLLFNGSLIWIGFCAIVCNLGMILKYRGSKKYRFKIREDLCLVEKLVLAVIKLIVYILPILTVLLFIVTYM